MARSSEQITALLDEMPALEELAKSLQMGEPRSPKSPSAEQLTTLQERYLDWYARCLSRFNDATQQMFMRQYTGTYGIHRFIGDPAGTGRTSTYQSSGYRYYWKNDFDDCFRKPFNEQRLILMQVRANAAVRENKPSVAPPPAIDTIRLHPRIKSVSTNLFKNGHYREAIFRACLALNEAVQQRSGRTEHDGNKLMMEVFSPKAPILQFASHPDEQMGYMWLFAGVMMAIRNPRAHHLGESEDLDSNEALEIIAMISALYRALDSAQTVTTVV